ncbi:ABC transporter permease [Patescibacteria group bacterium]|nr:ABC transporter permease [Patescibacteria group bacterium]MBU1931557.1 ABC transporter permease [Patescibacteria group bacterium]
MSTIYILWLRQLKRYWRSKPRIIGSLGQPILFLLALGFGMGPMFAKAGGGSYIDFLAPGVMAQAIVFMAIFSGVELIWDRQFGFLKETLVAPVSRLNIIIGRILGGSTIATLQGMIVLLLTLLIGFRPTNFLALPMAVVVMFLISLLYTALGTAIAANLKDFHGFQLIMNFLVMPSFFLSGALFPIQNAPASLQLISQVNPLTYGVDALRAVLVGTAHFGLAQDIFILTVIAAGLLIIGSWLFSRIQV